jgi:hypothetical protein
MENKKLPQHFVRNAGVFYVCHRLYSMVWNATPTTRYARGRNVVIDSEGEESSHPAGRNPSELPPPPRSSP